MANENIHHALGKLVRSESIGGAMVFYFEKGFEIKWDTSMPIDAEHIQFKMTHDLLLQI